MTINSEIRRAGPYQGNGVTTEFPFDFKVFKAEDLYVVVAPEGGDGELPLELGTDYTVVLNPDQNANPGGTIVAPTPLPVGFTLTATSSLEYLQPVDLTNQDGFYPRVVNDALDRLTIFVQQLVERLGRALVFPLSDGQVGEVPGVGRRAGAVLAFGEDGAPIVGPSITDVGTVVGAVQAIGTVAGSIEDVSTVADNVDDVTFIAAVYYGPNATNPTTRRDGSPLREGDLYFNTAENVMRVYDGTQWGVVASGGDSLTTVSGDARYLQISNNLSDITDNTLARSNLGLGTAATANLTTSNTDGTAGRVLRVGDGGWMSRGATQQTPYGYPSSVTDVTNQTKVIRTDAANDNGIPAFGSGFHFAAGDTWGRLRVRYDAPGAWIQGGIAAAAGTGWTSKVVLSDNLLQTTGSSTDFPMSQAAVSNAIIGVGQTWQDVTASRSVDVTYTNTTGRPIQVFVTFDPVGTNTHFQIDGINILPRADSRLYHVACIIPAGSTYRMGTSGSTSTLRWVELR